MRIVHALLPVAMLAGAPAAAQSFRPAVVTTDLSPLESLWHVRVALNVAALGCRDADETTTVAEYNALIRGQSAELTAASAAIDARYKAQYGASWQDARERDMTKLYNFFAQPAAQAVFRATVNNSRSPNCPRSKRRSGAIPVRNSPAILPRPRSSRSLPRCRSRRASSARGLSAAR